MLGDVVDPEFAAAAVSASESRFGGLHVLVNAAGAIIRGTVGETSDDEWNRMMSVNVTGTFFMSRAAIPALRRSGGGSIVNLGSTAGLFGCPDLAAYCAGKGAIVNLTRAMALDHAHESIRVNAIAPSWVDTEMNEGYLARIPDRAAAERQLCSLHPLGWIGSPSDIGDVAVWLAGGQSKFVTGQVIRVEGGRMAKLPLPAAFNV